MKTYENTSMSGMLQKFIWEKNEQWTITGISEHVRVITSSRNSIIKVIQLSRIWSTIEDSFPSDSSVSSFSIRLLWNSKYIVGTSVTHVRPHQDNKNHAAVLFSLPAQVQYVNEFALHLYPPADHRKLPIPSSGHCISWGSLSPSPFTPSESLLESKTVTRISWG